MPDRSWAVLIDNNQTWGGWAVDTTGSSISVTASQLNFPALLQGCSGTCAASATWAGVGGHNGTQALIQTGLDQSNLMTWYQLIPGDGPHGLWTVPSGDSMFAGVALDFPTGNWTYLIEDLSSGSGATGAFSFGPDTSTGEWISESKRTAPTPVFVVSVSQAMWRDQFGSWQAINSAEAPNQRWLTQFNPAGGCVQSTFYDGSGTGFTNSASACP
jgi:hypothetical protein